MFPSISWLIAWLSERALDSIMSEASRARVTITLGRGGQVYSSSELGFIFYFLFTILLLCFCGNFN